MVKFELVLPCYNEAKALVSLVEKAAGAATEAGYDPSQFQLILVENGSGDGSYEAMISLQKTSLGRWFRIIRLEQNRGYGAGVMAGLKATHAPIVGWTHADGQCDPRDAFAALKVLESSPWDKLLVKGIRNGRKWKERVFSRSFEFFAFLFLGLSVHELNAQPKVFPRELLLKLKNPPDKFAFDLYVLFTAAKENYRMSSIPVLFPARTQGSSHWASSWQGRVRTVLGMLAYLRALSKEEGRIDRIRA